MPDGDQYPPKVMEKIAEIRGVDESLNALQTQITSLREQLTGLSREEKSYDPIAAQITTTVNRMTAMRESREMLKAELHNLLHRYSIPATNINKLIAG